MSRVRSPYWPLTICFKKMAISEKAVFVFGWVSKVSFVTAYFNQRSVKFEQANWPFLWNCLLPRSEPQLSCFYSHLFVTSLKAEWPEPSQRTPMVSCDYYPELFNFGQTKILLEISVTSHNSKASFETSKNITLSTYLYKRYVFLQINESRSKNQSFLLISHSRKKSATVRTTVSERAEVYAEVSKWDVDI